MAKESIDRWQAKHMSNQILPGDEELPRETQTRGILDRYDKVWASAHRKQRNYPCFWLKRPTGEVVLLPTHPDAERIYKAKDFRMLTPKEAIAYVKQLPEQRNAELQYTRELEQKRKASEADGVTALLANLLVTLGVTNPEAVYEAVTGRIGNPPDVEDDATGISLSGSMPVSRGSQPLFSRNEL